MIFFEFLLPRCEATCQHACRHCRHDARSLQSVHLRFSLQHKISLSRSPTLRGSFSLHHSASCLSGFRFLCSPPPIGLKLNRAKAAPTSPDAAHMCAVASSKQSCAPRPSVDAARWRFECLCLRRSSDLSAEDCDSLFMARPSHDLLFETSL